MKLDYRIEILSDWHCGTGLDSGSDADALVIKDEYDLPFIPGKTIKGLLRDALREIAQVDEKMKDCIPKIFGKEAKEGLSGMAQPSVPGSAFFSNAGLSDEEREDIARNKLQAYLYRRIASTQIDKYGIAQDKSLRTIEVCRPLTLYGCIEGINNVEDRNALKMAMQWCRYMGAHRNRGLGRCRFVFLND